MASTILCKKSIPLPRLPAHLQRDTTAVMHSWVEREKALSIIDLEAQAAFKKQLRAALAPLDRRLPDAG